MARRRLCELLRLPESNAQYERERNDQQGHENTRHKTALPTGDPSRAFEHYIQKCSFRMRNYRRPDPEDKHSAPLDAAMKADCEPETAGQFQCQTHKKRIKYDAQKCD